VEARTARMTVWRTARVDRTPGGVEVSRQKPSTWMASIRRRLTETSTDESARERGSSLIEARARSKPSLGISLSTEKTTTSK
jgi:hypothetical protein